jgi:thiamine biosynthesis lipoprotein
LWGFHEPENIMPEPPDRDKILKLVRSNPNMSDLELKGITIRSRNPALLLDFGAFAKGYGIGSAIRTLKRFGFKNALVAAGGDLQVIGKPGNRSWHIAIKHPRSRGYIASINLKPGESIFTSGDYERFFMVGNTRYHHIIDPRTGRPARGVTSVTIIHDDPAEADAAATALFVAGPRDWYRIARKMGIRFVMLIDDKGRIHMNPAMIRRIKFRKGVKPVIIRSKAL